ncbi:MAG: 50S ribosomal protein L20 [Acholeplasmataceae bacterium]|nr:50S ribosomal protein L20 [Acholeplasmataceae bacterium]
MPRVKNSKVTRQRRKKVLKQAKGYFGSKRTLYRTANEQVMRSMRYQYRDRKQRKRQFRKLWITRINAAAKLNDMKYSQLIHGLKLAQVDINRKILADLAVHDEKAFTELTNIAKEAIKNPPKVEKVNNAPAKPEVKKETKAKVETKKEVEQDLESLTVAELKEIAKNKDLTGYSAFRKAELIKLIQEN